MTEEQIDLLDSIEDCRDSLLEFNNWIRKQIKDMLIEIAITYGVEEGNQYRFVIEKQASDVEGVLIDYSCILYNKELKEPSVVFTDIDTGDVMLKTTDCLSIDILIRTSDLAVERLLEIKQKENE